MKGELISFGMVAALILVWLLVRRFQRRKAEVEDGRLAGLRNQLAGLRNQWVAPAELMAATPPRAARLSSSGWVALILPVFLTTLIVGPIAWSAYPDLRPPASLLAMFVLVFSLWWRGFLLERNLLIWGEPIPAMIMKVTPGKGQECFIDYEFLDKDGNGVKGRGDSATVRGGPGSTITILVDSNKSARSTLYPPLYFLLQVSTSLGLPPR